MSSELIAIGRMRVESNRKWRLSINRSDVQIIVKTHPRPDTTHCFILVSL